MGRDAAVGRQVGRGDFCMLAKISFSSTAAAHFVQRGLEATRFNRVRLGQSGAEQGCHGRSN